MKPLLHLPRAAQRKSTGLNRPVPIAGMAQFLLVATGFLFAHPALSAAAVSQETAEPGTVVYRKGEAINLYDGQLKVGTSFRPYADLLGLQLKGPSVISVVPSIDTPVCEEQSHLMGESLDLRPEVQRVVISRDTPMAQARFSKEAQLSQVAFVSDFTNAAFGKQSGLLMKGPELLARAVVVLDAEGTIQHLQVVRDITQLPDMKTAFELANKLIAPAAQ